jgi:protein O-GlcNAc transferase
VEYHKGCALRAQGRLPAALAVVDAALQAAGIGTAVRSVRPPQLPGRRNRSHFRLPHGGTLYLCPQTLFKLHPDFDPLLRGILERDSRGYLVLVRGQYPEWAAALRERFAGTLGALAERVRFIDSVPSEDFLELLGLADVMLDPPHFNGMNSSLETFAVGLPIITLPSLLQRGRHTRAMYLCMGITDCIAVDEHLYVDFAVRSVPTPTSTPRCTRASSRTTTFSTGIHGWCGNSSAFS